MTQFIKNGPDVPERLLQKHEEGDVVFFCGAGISRPMLPDFGGLAKSLYEHLGIVPTPAQKAALDAEQYDTAIGLLERDYIGGRSEVRKEMASILSDYNASVQATKTHKALLTLGLARGDNVRLVTTNFDRLFEEVKSRERLEIETFQAPLLPVPKKRWNGLVYLHGLLPISPNENQLDCLVVSSGDFGLAYLSERWAARFVSELFRNYTVCFVGYSIKDPVLRYMMDALAADQQRGENPLEMFAFGDYKKGTKQDIEDEWKAKNVTPILYKNTEKHSYLHKTLNRWAEIYRDGVRGKEQIIVKEASSNPLKRTVQDDFVGRVLWALSDESGLPAKRFAKHEPVPPLDWLKPLSETCFGYKDLTSFGVTPKEENNTELAFSMLRRPAPYNLAPWMSLVDRWKMDTNWDHVMNYLAQWLVRYLDEPALILWLARHGGQLHHDFVGLIDKELKKITEYELRGKTGELESIRASSPHGIPRPMLRKVWRLMLSGRIKSHFYDYELYTWLKRFKNEGLTSNLRLDLRDLLTPCIELREPFAMDEDVGRAEDPKDLKEIVDWELRLRSDHVHLAFADITSTAKWQAALPKLLPDFNLLLKDAFDLMYDLGGIDEYRDFSYLHQPSISQHPQNRKFRDWTALIDLTRDAWVALSLVNQEHARSMARQWQQTSYPLFKRLSFFAAAEESIIPVDQAVDWLLADKCWWLWSIETQREVLRLLVTLTPNLNQTLQTRLEESILPGPPREMFREDVDSQQWERIKDHEVWLRLSKMEDAGAALGVQAQIVFKELSNKYPQWQLFEDKRDEFPFWMGEGDEFRKFVATPRKRRELVKWLQENPDSNNWQEDDWRQRCRDEFSTTACALCELGRKNEWPPGRWREALQAWSEEKLLKRSWRYMAPVLNNAPQGLIDELSHSMSWWLHGVAKTFDRHQEIFFSFCFNILNLDYKEEESEPDDPVTKAINHPVGLATEALLRWWYRNELQDNQGLPEKLWLIFTKLCNPQIQIYRHARLLLAANVIPLFRVDPEWTKQSIVPFFDWSKSNREVIAIWKGFLWAPRLYSPFFELIKSDFLETARHYYELGDHGPQYATLLTFIALEPCEAFFKNELRSATEILPDEGRREALEALVRGLQGSGGQRESYWRNRILPFLKSVWPQSREYRSQILAGPLARLCIAAGDAFPEALDKLKPWLQVVQYPGVIIIQLEREGLAKRYPKATLEFLEKIIDVDFLFPPSEFEKCLDDVKNAAPQLENTSRFRALQDYLRQNRRR